MKNNCLYNAHRLARLFFIAVVTAISFSLCLQAQPSGEKGMPFITNYLPKTYKAPPQTFSIIEDGRGFMYFGIQNGLLEYDGVKWRKVIFKQIPPIVRALARDKNGVIFYGSVGDFGYLAQDSLGQTIAVSYKDYIPAQYRNFHDVWTIYVNGSDIYFQSREYIFRINDKKEVKTWMPSTKFMYAFLLDGKYFVHQQGIGLLQLVKDSLQLIPGSEFTGQERTQVMLPYRPGSASNNPSAPGQYLVGMFYSGLYIYDGKSFKPFKTDADAIIKTATLYKGALLTNGNYVLSTTGKGLLTLSPDGRVLQLINRDVGLQDESVYAVYSDSRGILWLALDNGISRVETNSPLTQFTNQSGINTATLSIERFNGKLYLGTTNGLLKLNAATGQFNEIPQVPPNQTFSLLKDGNTLLIPNDGLFAIRDEKVSLIRPSIGGDMQLSGLHIPKNHPDVLFGAATFGVAVFLRDEKTGSWKFNGFVPNLDDQFWTFADNKDGSFWAGTQTGSVYLVKPAYGTNGQPDASRFVFEKFGEKHGIRNALGSVYHIKGENYFVGDSSLYRFDEKQKKFYRDTSFGNFVQGGAFGEFDVKEDHNGRVWMRFGKETIIATALPGGKYKIDKTSLLPVAERTFSKFFPEKNGITWICTSDGLIRFDENLHKDYDLPFTTWIRNINAGKNRLNPLLAGNSEFNSSISYSNNTMRFEYAAPFFEQEDKTLYQTWLEGFEPGWSGYDNNYYKEYTNLPAGKYSFHVRAKNVYQKTSAESVYSFTVLPPWYANWWAYTIYAIAALALIGFIVRYRTRQLKAKHRELEKTVALRTAELSHRVDELAVINKVQEGLVKEIGIQDIYDLVGEKIREIFNAQVIDIVTYDPRTNLMEDRYAYEKGDRTLLGPRPPQGFRKHIIESRESLVLNENIKATVEKYGHKVLIGEEAKSVALVPMITGGEVKGIISLQDLDKEHAFSESDVSLLTTLANSMSVALESARRFDETHRLLKETEQRNAELAVINSVQDGLVREMDIQGIYYLVGEKIREIFDAQVIDIVTYDRKSNLIDDKYAFEKGDRTLLGPREPQGFRKHIIETGEQLVINDNATGIGKQYNNKVIVGDDPKSLVLVPMITGGQVTGIISLQNIDHENAFSDSNVRLINTLANSMSIALESARLFDETKRLLKETEQRIAELSVINSVQEGLVAQMKMESIYSLVGDRIRDLFDAQVVVIRTYDFDNEREIFNYAIEKGNRLDIKPLKFDDFTRHLIKIKKPILVNNNFEDFIKAYSKDVALEGDVPKSALFVPMILADTVIGNVSLQNVDHENAFTETDVSLLSTLVNSMSVALKSARLFDETTRLLKETEQRNAELAVINSVQEGLVREMNIQGIYELVGEKIREIFNAQVIDIVTYDRNTNLIEDKYAYEKGDRSLLGPREPKGFRRHVIESGEMLLHNENVGEISKTFANEVLIGEMPKSQIFYPLMAGGKVNGVISLQNLDHEHAFSESDINLITTLSNSMSLALESARLFDETNRLLKETEQRNAELAVINSVQESLVAQMDIKGIYELVGEKMREIFNAQVIDIVTYDKETNLIEDKYAYEKGDRTLLGSRSPKGFRNHVIKSGQLLVINKDLEKLRTKYDNTVIVGHAAKSLVLVPMIAGGEVTGVISLQNLDQEDAFSESDISLLVTLVNSMSVALKSARLFDETKMLLKETEQRKAELAVINNVQEGLVKEFKSTAIYELVGEKLCELFDTQTVLIRTFEHETGTEVWRYAIEKGKRQYSEPRPLIWANKRLIETHKPLVINENYLETAKKFGGTGVSIGQPPKSAVFVPMIVGGVVRGSVSLQNVDKEHAFTEAELGLLTALTSSMGVALENTRLFDETTRLLDETKQRAAELSTVNSISQTLASQLNPEELIKLVGDQLRDLFKANIVYLALIDPMTKIIRFPYQYGDDLTPMRLGEGLTSQILLTGKPLLINKDVDEQTIRLGVQRMGIPAASYLGVPIPIGDEIIGVLSVQSTESENRFNENDERLLSTIAASVGVALRKAQLFEEVTQAKQQAEEASTTADKANQAKSAFLSTVSHELRTPLTSVLGFAKIIRKRLEEKIFPATDKTDPRVGKTIQQVSDNLAVVVSEGERLTNLINEVLDLAKIEAGKMEWNMEMVSMQEVADRALAATTSLFDQKNLELKTNISDDLPFINGDRDKLIQVMVNLISNAVKFTVSGVITCSITHKKNEIITGITDTGIGIAPADHAVVFEQFKQVVGDTLTDKPKGTGLGLPICKEIIEHHGGHIWLKSELGKGSTFYFALPVPKQASIKPIHLDDLVKQLKEQVAQSKFKLNGNHATILVVDDDDSIRSLLQQELGDVGYLIEEASNGKEALSKIRHHHPDLIILDVMMPEMNGFDVAAILKNDPKTMDIPIIVLSIVQDKARGYRIGVDRYLTKPIDTAQLFAEVGSLLGQGKSKKKVMVVDEDTTAVRSLTDVLQAKGYQVVESDGRELMEKAIKTQPDIIILNSLLSDKQEIVQSLRFEKGLENVLLLIYQ